MKITTILNFKIQLAQKTMNSCTAITLYFIKMESVASN